MHEGGRSRKSYTKRAHHILHKHTVTHSPIASLTLLSLTSSQVYSRLLNSDALNWLRHIHYFLILVSPLFVNLICVLVTQLCLTLWDPMDCSPPGSSVPGILQARILEWVAIPCSRGSSWPGDQTQVSCTAGRFFTIWAIGKSSNKKS